LFDVIQAMGLVYQTFYHLSRAIGHCCFGYRVIGAEKIPQNGGLILAMNHQSFLDPPLAGIASDREVFYLARKTLMDIPVLGSILPHLNVIPYDQEGSDMSAIKSVIRVVRAGEAAVIFPEGTRSPDGSLLPVQHGVGMIVAKTMAPVIPMRIFGAHEAFPKGSSKIHFKPVTIVVGNLLQFTPEDFEGEQRAAYQRVSERVMAAIASLHCPPRRPVIE
jgi:1-acyl-sn-glycerol-3-phosphate acyltransferase